MPRAIRFADVRGRPAEFASGFARKRVYLGRNPNRRFDSCDNTRSRRESVSRCSFERSLMRPKWMVTTACCLMAVICGGAQAGQITGIVSFGDSLSDVGNDFIGSGGTQPDPPADYYKAGSPMAATGLTTWPRTWAWRPPVAALAGGSNYAFGGASTGPGFTTFVPGQQVPNVDTQIGLYLAGHTPGAGQLFTIWAGANDLLARQSDQSRHSGPKYRQRDHDAGQCRRQAIPHPESPVTGRNPADEHPECARSPKPRRYGRSASIRRCRRM